MALAAHAGDGTLLATLSYRLGGVSWFQANQPLPEGTSYAVLTSATPGAAYLAYASVVDRRTDDPTYVAAVRISD